MNPNELRALADALHWVQYTADWQTCDRAADYLRAQADAQPVAWRTFDGEGNYDYRAYELNEDYADEWNRRNPNHVGWVEPLYTHPAPTAPHHAMLDSHRRLVEQAIQSAEHPSGMSTHDGKARIDASILRRMLAIIDSLSAVPAGWKLVPVEPTPEMLSAVGMMDGYDWHAPGCSPDADHANWYSAMIAAAPAAPQAEPKREPLSDERIDKIGEPFGYFQYGDAQGDRRRAFIDRLTRARDEARAERDAMANVLPGHYYMDPPDGGDVPVLEQLRRMAKDAARYRFLSCKGVPPYFHRCSRWRLEYWNGEWWDPLMKEELDAAIDAQIEQERGEQAKEPK